MRRASLAVLACALLAGCSGPQSALDPAGDQAGHLVNLWSLMLVVCGVMYLLVLGFLGWSIWRARGKLQPADVPPDLEPADVGLRKTLVVWAGMIVVGLTILVVASFLVDRAFATADQRNALNVRITGNQWWWQVEYQDGPVNRWFVTANELRLPAGRPVKLTLQANDVIHSFWIPNLAGKMDMIPGRINELTLNPRRPGAYRGQCAEFCGFQHAKMALDVTVEPAPAFEAWREKQLQPAPTATTPLLARGQEVFQQSACVVCHQIVGAEAGGKTAPDLTHVASRKTLAAGTLPYSQGALAAWIADPKRFKPGTTMPAVKLSGADLGALVAYLDSLK